MNKPKSQNIVTAEQYLKDKKINFISPEKIIISYYSQIDLSKFTLVKEWNRGQLYIYKKIGVVINLGIGNSILNLLTEELCVLGAKEFIIIGYAGALNPKLKSGQLINSKKSKIYSTNDPYEEENKKWFIKMTKEKYDAVDMETKYLEKKAEKLKCKTQSYLIITDKLTINGWERKIDSEKIKQKFVDTFNKIIR